MSTESDVLRATRLHRKRLESLESSAIAVMEARYREIVAFQMAEFNKLIGELNFLRATDPSKITIGRIFRTERARSLFIQAEEQWGEYAQLLGRQTSTIAAAAARQAEQDASELARYALGPAPPGVNADLLFTQLPKDSIINIAGIVESGPLRDILDEYPYMASLELQNALVTGLASGLHPAQVARRMAAAMGNNLARARTIARTEMLRAYREQQLQHYKNSRLVKYWVWHSALGTRTCAACWALHGRKFPKDEPMGTHPNCRCALVPVTYTWRELGFNVPESFESSYKPELGTDLFDKLGAGDQRAILGRKGFELYENGDLDLGDMVREVRTDAWGITRSRASLKTATARKAARGGGDFPGWPEPSSSKPPLPSDPRARDVLRSRRAADASRRARAQGATKPKAPAKPKAPKQAQPAAPPRPAHAQEIDRMKAGKTRADWTEAEIRDAGAVARKEIDRRVDVSDLDAQKIRLARDVDHLERDLVRINDSDAALYARYKRDEIDFLDYRDEARKINDARTQVQRELIAKRREIQAVQALSTERRVQTTREVLGEIRPYGGGREVQFQKVKSGNTQTLPSKKKAIAADEMNAVRMNYPDEWWDEMADSLEDRRFSVGFNDRGYFSEGRREIRISDRAASWSKTTDERVISGLRNVATHEAGHAMEYTIPDIVRLEGDFWRRRTAGQSMERLSRIFPNHGYRSDERAILDDFIHAYIGKDYHGRYYEVLSMGNDSLLGDPLLNDRNEEMWGKDTDMIDFILGLLAAL